MRKIFTPVLSVILLFFSCKQETEYQYEVNPVNVAQEGSEKTNRKSTSEFISIAYSDLYGAAIPQTKLVNLSVAYSSFGDLSVIEERIISNFLNDSLVHVPASITVNGDTMQFVINSYKKFYNRNPNEFEKYKWMQMIRSDANVTPATMYFAMMTSDEYRYY
jgi:hypothetical protein